jgi:ATP-binding cassette subfamily A (ABC1) protein 3
LSDSPSARLASIVGPFALFAMVMPRYVFFQTDEVQALGAKRAASVLAPTAFTFAADLLATREGAERGVTWDTMYDDPFSLGELMGLLLVDACIYTVAAWYLSRVLPTAHGTPLPWWFIFSLKFWRGPGAGEGRGSGRGRAILDVEEGAGAGGADGGLSGLLAAAETAEEAASAGGAAIELVATTATAAATTTASDGGGVNGDGTNRIAPAVVIQGLSKTYNPKGSCAVFLSGAGHPVHAVKPLHLALYEGQVTGLLGPNGAGKSTTIAMLTGLTPPTSGDAQVMGHSLRHSLADARRTLGVCPQQNVLFPTLTCMEHLRIYATIKGVPSRDVEAAAIEKLREVGLEAKADARSATLSGGMKRRLQMALALIGPSRVVLLDEPTSGLDPVSRRDAWVLIRAAAKGRCIVLTTHFLEEADLLCDRVAIISGGRLRCAGSPPFLKNALGGKYALTITFDGGALHVESS